MELSFLSISKPAKLAPLQNTQLGRNDSTFSSRSFPSAKEPQREAEFNTIKRTVCRSSYHYPHIKTEAKQTS